MRKKALLLLTLMPLLSSCEVPTGMIKKVKDVTKNYIGAYPTARLQESGKDYDQYLYISFVETNEVTDSGFEPDIIVNLNDRFLESFGTCQKYYDVATGYQKLIPGSTLQEWFKKDHYVCFYTGIGSPDETPRFISQPAFTKTPGEIISLSTIQNRYDKLTMTVADCYQEEIEWRFWKW